MHSLSGLSKVSRARMLLACASLASATVACGNGNSQTPSLQAPTGATGATGATAPPPMQICLLPMGAQNNTCSALTASPSYTPTIDLGFVQVGSLAWNEVTITNQGTTPLDLAPLDLETGAPAGISIVGNWGQPVSIPAGQTQTAIIALEAGSGDPNFFFAVLDITVQGSATASAKVPIFALIGASLCPGQPPIANMVITDHGNPVTPDSSGNYDFTVNSTAVFNATGSMPSTGLTYLWDVAAEPVGANASLSSPNSAIVDLPLPTAGTYQVSLLVSDGTCVGTEIIATLSVTP